MLKAAKAYLSTQVSTASKGDLLLMLYDTSIKHLDQPPRVVPLIVLVCDACLSPEVVPRGSALRLGGGWPPVPAGVAPVHYVV